MTTPRICIAVIGPLAHLVAPCEVSYSAAERNRTPDLCGESAASLANGDSSSPIAPLATVSLNALRSCEPRQRRLQQLAKGAGLDSNQRLLPLCDTTVVPKPLMTHSRRQGFTLSQPLLSV